MISSIVAGLISGGIVAFLFKYIFPPKIERVFSSNQKGSIKSTFQILYVMYFEIILKIMKELEETNFDVNQIQTITTFASQTSERDGFIKHLDNNSTYLDYNLRMTLHNTSFYAMAFLVNLKNGTNLSELKIIKNDVFEILGNRDIQLDECSRDILETFVFEYSNLVKKWNKIHN